MFCPSFFFFQRSRIEKKYWKKWWEDKGNAIYSDSELTSRRHILSEIILCGFCCPGKIERVILPATLDTPNNWYTKMFWESASHAIVQAGLRRVILLHSYARPTFIFYSFRSIWARTDWNICISGCGWVSCCKGCGTGRSDCKRGRFCSRNIIQVYVWTEWGQSYSMVAVSTSKVGMFLPLIAVLVLYFMQGTLFVLLLVIRF